MPCITLYASQNVVQHLKCLDYSGKRTSCCGQCLQNEWQQLLLITSYNSVYQEKNKIHSLSKFAQPSCVITSWKSAIVLLVLNSCLTATLQLLGFTLIPLVIGLALMCNNSHLRNTIILKLFSKAHFQIFALVSCI